MYSPSSSAFRRSIKAKFMIMTVGIVLGVVCVLTFVMAQNSAKLLQNESRQQLSQLLNQSVDILSGFLDVREATLELWASNPLVNAVVSDRALASVFVPSLRAYFSKFKEKEPWIETIFLIQDDTVAYDDSDTFEFSDGSNDTSDGLQNLLALPLEGLSVLNLQTFSPKLDRNVIVMKRQLLQEGSPVEGGFIVLLLDLEAINNRLFDKIKVGKHGFMSMVAHLSSSEASGVWIPQQNVVGPERSDFAEASKQWRQLSDIPNLYKSIVLDRRELRNSPLTIVGIASRNDVREPVMRLISTSVIFGILATIMGIFGAFFFSEKLTAPIRELTTKARQFATGDLRPQAQGALPDEKASRRDFDTFIEVRSTDEIGELASAFNQMAKALSVLITELEHRNDMSRAVISTRDLEEILETVVKGVAESGGYDRVRLYLHDDRQNRLVCHTAFGMDQEKIRHLQLPLSGAKAGVSQWVFLEKTPYVVEDASRDEKCDPALVQLLDLTSYAVVPLLAGEKAIGVLAVDYVKTRQPFPQERLNSLVAFTNTAALAIENALLYRNLEERVQERTRQLEIANQRLQELDQLKSDFLSTVSHELRTPLTSVLGFARIISKRFHESLLPHLDQSQTKVQRDAKRTQENLEIIIDEGERLTRLINEVLDLAKIESGKMDWKMQEMSLHDIVQSGVNATSSLAREKGLDVQVVTQGEDFHVYGDLDRLTQVVTNLLSNAIKFTDEGSITCALERGEDAITVKVMDTGIGIAPEELGQVFEKFKQVGDTLTDKPKGTGLGLPICKEIIEHHGGKIWVESELRQGSAFIFTLPSRRQQAGLAQEIPLFSQVKDHVSAQLPQHVEETPRILIVDDEKPIRTLLSQELEGAGYGVIEAQDGHEALQVARSQKPDLIILDILMPGLDGFEVTTLLKQDEETAGIPILILSIVEDQEKGYRLGVDRYLTKPIDSEQLLTTVSSLVARGQPTETLTQRKILVIEEDEGIIRAIERVLRAYQIISVNNAQEAIRRAKEEHPELIILDASLTDAGAIVKALRSLRETRESQLLVLTAPLKAEITTMLDTLNNA